MPIPGDNGKPREEREKQNERIQKEGTDGGKLRKELEFNKPSPTIWPNIK